MRDLRANRVIPWLLAISLLLIPMAGGGIDAQTTSGSTAGPSVQTEPRRGSSPNPSRAGRATHGGLHIADLTTGITAQQLANSLVGGQGVTISNVSYTGAQVSAGTFNGGSSIIGI